MTAIEKLEKELRRLGAGTTDTTPEGIAIYDEAELPRGWVRLSDGTGEVFGDAEALADRLSRISATGEVREDGSDVDWEATWEALGEVGEDHAPLIQ